MPHSRRLFVAAITVLCAIVVFSFIGISLFYNRPKSVSEVDLEKYAQTFMTTYNQQLAFFNKAERTYFFLHPDSSYAITSYVSSLYGTAMLIQPSTDWSFENHIVEQRVEEAVFGGNISETWAMFKIPENGHDITIEALGAAKPNGSANTNGHPFIELGKNSSVLIESFTVNSIFYPCIILRGNNDAHSWDNATAEYEAKRVFQSDLRYALANSEEVRRTYSVPVLMILLQNIENKWKSQQQTNAVYTPSQMEDDIQDVIDIAATQYGISNSSDFIHRILAYVKDQIPPPPPPVKTVFYIAVGMDEGNWWYVFGWCFLPFFAYTFFAVYRLLNNKFKSRDLKFWYGVISGTAISPFFTSLIADAPYDYQIGSLQTGIIIIVVGTGFLLIYVTKHVAKRTRLTGIAQLNEQR